MLAMSRNLIVLCLTIALFGAAGVCEAGDFLPKISDTNCENLLGVMEAHAKVMREAMEWQKKALEPSATDADRLALIHKILETMKIEEPKLSTAAAIARGQRLSNSTQPTSSSPKV